MNASDFAATIQEVISADHNSKTSQCLGSVVEAYQALQTAPNNPNLQNSAKIALGNLRTSVMSSEYAGIELENRFPQKNNNYLFDKRLINEIDSIISINTNTPSTILQRISDLYSARNAILSQFSATVAAATDLGISISFVEKGDTQIGFVVPRVYFSNTAEGLSKEIGQLNFIMKVFSNLISETIEIPKVASLATSDPSLFFHLSPEAIQSILHGVQTAIDIIKDLSALATAVQVVRKFMPGGAAEDLSKDYDAKLKARVDDHVAKLMSAADDNAKKQNAQLEAEVARALTLLVERMSNGVTVRVLAGPPQGDSPSQDVEKYIEQRTKIIDAAANLRFPRLEAEEMKLITQDDNPIQPASSRSIQ